jgi:hypothetical protein
MLDEDTNQVTLTIAATSPNSGTLSYQWFRNGAAITGATGTSFTATQTGNYHVVVSNNRNGSIGTRSSTICNVTAPAEVTITRLGDVIVSVGANNAAVLANFRGRADDGASVPLQINGSINFNQAGTYNVTIAPVAGRGSLEASVQVVPRAVYASDFGWASNSTVGWSVITADFGIEPAGSPLLLTGTGGAVEYRKGVFAHANSNVIFNVAGEGFTAFRSYVGINRLAAGPRNTTGTTVFEVWVDGERRFQSSAMNGSAAAVFVDVDITGAGTVELRATATSNGSAHSTWADAMFISGGDVQPPPAYGDVNGDGFINAADVTILRRFIASQKTAADFILTEAPDFKPANADANGDGRIDSEDVTILRSRLAAADPSSVPLGPQTHP